MDEINVILISSVRPERSMSGALILHRHLMNRRGIRLHILPAEHHEIVHSRFHSKIVPRLMRTPARRWAGDIDYLMHTTLPLEKHLAAPPAVAREQLFLHSHTAAAAGWRNATRGGTDCR